MNRLEFTEPAQADLQDIQDHIAEHSLAAARRWIRTLEIQCQKLGDMPGMGRRRDEFSPGLRSFPVSAYIIFYRATDDGIQILRVIHGSRDIPNIL
jgi:toxin ParE1/3/4